MVDLQIEILKILKANNGCYCSDVLSYFCKTNKYNVNDIDDVIEHMVRSGYIKASDPDDINLSFLTIMPLGVLNIFQNEKESKRQWFNLICYIITTAIAVLSLLSSIGIIHWH